MSLIEVLIAVAIMGLAMTAMLGALGSQISGARAHRDHSNAGTVVTAALERVKAASYNSSCSATAASDYLAAARGATLPSDWTAKSWTPAQAINTAGSVQYWNGTAFTNTCRDTEATDVAGLFRQQQLTIVVKGPHGPEESFTVVKTGPIP